MAEHPDGSRGALTAARNAHDMYMYQRRGIGREGKGFALEARYYILGILGTHIHASYLKSSQKQDTHKIDMLLRERARDSTLELFNVKRTFCCYC